MVSSRTIRHSGFLKYVLIICIFRCATISNAQTTGKHTTPIAQTTGYTTPITQTTGENTTSIAQTPITTPKSAVELLIETIDLNRELVKEKFGPLVNALVPYFSGGSGENSVLDALQVPMLTLALVDFPEFLKLPPVHELVLKFEERVGNVDFSQIQLNDTGAIFKTIAGTLAWDAFLQDIYQIGNKYQLISSTPSVRQTIEMVLLNFTLGTLPQFLKIPLVWDVRDLFIYQLMQVNYTGVDKSNLASVVGAIGMQVDWDAILDGFYQKFRLYGMYPAKPSISFVIETLLLNFTFHTVPHILKNPIFQAAEYIVMEQFKKVNLAGADPSNMGQVIKSIIDQMKLAEVFAKINAIPGVQDPQKQVLPISKQCSSDTEYLVDSMLSGKSWALTMLDALGKPGEGIFKGNLYMIGSYDQCLSAVATQEFVSRLGNKTTEMERFRAKFCKVTIDLPPSFVDGLGVDTRGVPVRLSWGLCIPDSCGETDLKGLLTSGVMSRVDLNFREVLCASIPELAEDGSAIAAIVILSFLGCLVVIGTLVDLIRKQSIQAEDTGHKPTENGSNGVKSEKGHFNGGYISDGTGKESYQLTPIPVVEHGTGENGNLGNQSGENGDVMPVEKAPIRTERPKRESVAANMLISFSVISNVPKILAAKHPKGSITCLNGIRYLSMAWVILCHTYYYGVFSVSDSQTTENLIDANSFIQRFTLEPLVYGTFSVDTFFVLSGFLVAYLFFKDLDKRKGKINCTKMIIFYVHRFWRLTPIYMIVLMMFACLYKYVIYGPLAPRDMLNADYCKENWWTNLLYISNLVRVDDMCMGWTWYLSNDMQFYIISPIFILSLYFFPVIGIILTSLLIGAHIASSAVIENRGAGNMLSINDVQPGKPSYYNDLYVKPYCRVGAYAIGLLLGKILHKRSNVKTGKITATIGWIVALTAGLFITYCSYTELKEGAEPWSQDIRTAYESLSRIVFASCVAWVIYACHTGRGGYINSILSWQGLIPMARLTYAAYLIHPIIMFMYMYSRRTLIYLSDYSMIYFYLGHMCLAYGAAFILSVLFESPFLGLEKILLKLLGK